MIEKYPLSSRLLHWVMAAIIIFILVLGIYMTEFLDKSSPNRMFIYNLHKSLGVLVIFLVFFRIVNRLFCKTPPLPKSITNWEKFLAHFTHFVLYGLMILVPTSGYLMSNYFGYPVYFFKLKTIFLVATDVEMAKYFAEIHELSAYTLICFIALHIAGVVKHRFFDKPQVNLLKRMI